MRDSCLQSCRGIIPVILFIIALLSVQAAVRGDERFVPPPSDRVTFNFNPGWKFIKGDALGADSVEFDDSSWQMIGLPHTYNDVDSFRTIITKGGDHGTYQGIAWYRKHFKIPSQFRGRKVFLEFEGLRQSGTFFINGKLAGKIENGVTACGLDITPWATFGDKENIIAVKVDNGNVEEEATNTPFEWESRDFNANYGGINRDAWLHITPTVYQTLPIFENLGTTGTYVYASNFDLTGESADITVESQVRNESGDQRSVDFSAVIVDREGNVAGKLSGDTSDMVASETNILTATGRVSGLHWWSGRDPYLYDVYCIVSIDGKTVDIRKITTGFRKVDFRGGAGTGGVYVNGKFVWLRGYAQRSTNEWAGLGQAFPDWLHDYTANCVRQSNANFIRWTHVSPMAQDVRACDRFGIFEICPAGDKEKDVQGAQWNQRLAVMRDSMIYYRNDPSIIFWEAGNNGISADHMKDMQGLHEKWDPNGERALGCRSLSDEGAVQQSQYYGTMLSMDPRIYDLKGPTDTFRGYSEERRDRAPMIECEDFRDEGARRFWDAYSPPTFGFHKKPEDTYDYNSETFALAGVRRYYLYVSEMISNPDPKHSKWAGYLDNHFTDTNSFGRQFGSEVARVSGKMDAVRLPKEIYFARRVIQNDQPDIHIIGHWTYPAGTAKTVYVISNCQSVQLFVNGVSMGIAKPESGYIFAFPNIKFEPGEIKAVGSNQGKSAAEDSIKTAGAPARIKLTAHTAPGGLRADGSDVALIDFEVVDSAGNRCPTDEARVNFKVDGPAIWRGGYNSGIPKSTNNLYLETECGINRVAIKSTLTPGTITVTATRAGLTAGKVEIVSVSAGVEDGLSAEFPARMGL
jgi:beta-galactosidase